MFAQNITIMAGDHHAILDNNTKKCLNVPQKGINIGNHIWVARNVSILKDVTIPNNCIL